MRNFLKKYFKVAVALGLITFLTSLPLMTKYVLQGENVLGSLSRIETMAEGLWKCFPIRIQPLSDSQYGYGTFFFQSNIFIYIPAFLRSIGFNLLTAWQITMWIINICTAVITYICFEKCIGQQDLGILGSMLYMWCPYRLNILYTNGDIGESMAWCFFPLLFLGLCRLYTEHEKRRLWILPTTALCLIAASSMTMFLVASGIALLWLVFMGKKLWKKEMLTVILKTITATGLLNAWLLVPHLYFMYKNVEMVGRAIPDNVRAFGVNPLSYLMIFWRGGISADFWSAGMMNVQSLVPGFAVTACIILWVYCLFTKQFKTRGELPDKRLFVLALAFVWMGSGLFPWEFLWNKNLIFSVVLAWMHTPAVWGIGACLILIFIACHVLHLIGVEKRGYYKLCLWGTVAVSFLTTQFLLDNILLQRSFIRAAAEEWGRLPIQIIYDIPLLWRFGEVISLGTLVCLLEICLIRRRRNVKRIGISQK